MNLSTVNQTDTLLPYFVGAILGIISLFVSGFFKEFFDERARIAEHKRNVARHVLKICIEASTNNFKHEPRNMEDIYSVLTDLEGIDKEMSVQMERFVSSWALINNRTKSDLSHDNVRLLTKNLSDIEKQRKVLIAWANKIRTGKKSEEE
jgi:hypothetical protein